MRYLIVNADDLGASPGITAGILEAYRHGIVTSASLLVDTPWSAEAAALAHDFSSVGVHVHFDRKSAKPFTDEEYRDELRRQVHRFRELTGRLPTHLDSHHDVHGDPRILPHFLEVGARYGVPVRGHGPIRFVGEFYGQWAGDVHPEQISTDGLRRILRSAVGDGVTELACHPGYVDADCRSSYAREREMELRTLCDPAARAALAEYRIELIGFGDARCHLPPEDSWPRS